MIHHISIDIQSIIEKASAQSANDFRALRISTNKVINEVYDDFVFMSDQQEAASLQIDFTAKMLRTKLGAHVVDFSSTPEEVVFDVAVDDCRVDDSLESLLAECILSNVLSWWYTLRNAELSNLYAQRANDAADEALHILTPKFTTHRGRMF